MRDIYRCVVVTAGVVLELMDNQTKARHKKVQINLMIENVFSDCNYLDSIKLCTCFIGAADPELIDPTQKNGTFSLHLNISFTPWLPGIQK